jgi:hypothetical protein
MLLIDPNNAADNYYSSLSFSEALKLLVNTKRPAFVKSK